MTVLDAVADGVVLGLRKIRRRWGLVVALAVVLFIINAPVLVAAQEESAEVQQLLSAGDKLLIAGRSSYPDAIAKYSAAMNLAPNSAKAALRRAELYWMMKKWTEVKQDLKKVLSLDPTNKKALERHATLLAAEGDVTEASAVYKRLAAAHGSGKKADEALHKAGKTAMLGRSWDLIKANLDVKDLDQRIDNNNKCVNILSELITEFAKDNMALHLKRAECAVSGRNQRAAMDELKYLLTRDSQNLRAIALNAKSLRQLGSIEGAKREVKRCLSLDPEDAGCVELHKSIKSYAKVTDAIQRSVNQNAWQEAIESIDSLLATEVDPPNLEQLWTWKCKGYLELRQVKEGIEACTTCIKLEGGKDDSANPALIDVYLNRADIHLLDDAIEEATADVRKAADINSNNDRVKEYQQKLENIKRNKARKDYYNILGVPKTANDKSIKSAYRKLAMKYHPDQYRSKDISEADREKNDRRFRDINEAKEILLDEEKRRRYDNGEDPANPQQQQQQQHQQFHFQGGGFPGGGFGNGFPGGFHFNFG